MQDDAVGRLEQLNQEIETLREGLARAQVERGDAIRRLEALSDRVRLWEMRTLDVDKRTEELMARVSVMISARVDPPRRRRHLVALPPPVIRNSKPLIS